MTRKPPNCVTCDDTGFKDYGGHRMVPCDCLQPFLPCPFCFSTLMTLQGHAQHPVADCILSGQLICQEEYRQWNKRAKLPVARAASSAADAPLPHPDDLAVSRFAEKMRAKMQRSREVKGRSGWNDPAQCSTADLRRGLYGHLRKDDPVDVANFCMMLDARGAGTAWLGGAE